MRVPIIKHATKFIEKHDSDYIEETITVLEDLAEAPGIKEEELDVMGEILSNLYGALEVQKMIADGKSQKDALNEFMKRVTGSIS